jgi:hypothetical protein
LSSPGLTGQPSIPPPWHFTYPRRRGVLHHPIKAGDDDQL